MNFMEMVGIKRFNYIRSPYLIVIFCFIINRAFAQTWSVPAKSGEMMFNVTVYVESIYQKPGSNTKDTLAGTGTLITDKGKIYLITAKHNLVRFLFAKDQQLANDSIYINPSWRPTVKGIQIRNLSGRAGIKPAVVFSPDEEDLAIISLQRKQDKAMLTKFWRNDKKPIPLKLISQLNKYHPGDSFYHVHFNAFWDKKGKPQISQGLGPETIVSYNPKSPLFTIKDYYGRGTDGSPLFMNNKMIGMVTGAEGIKPSTGITVQEGHSKESTVTVMKASYILPLLKSLQKIEN